MIISLLWRKALFFACILALTACSNRYLYDPAQAVSRLEVASACTVETNTHQWENHLDAQSIKDEVDRLANPLVMSHENVGVVVSVSVAESAPQTFHYGYKNLARHQQMTNDTVLALGSVTKSLVVSLLLVLDQKGLISLDDSIGNYLPPQMPLVDPRIAKITFRQLASHKSGLPREPVELESLEKLLKYTFTGENIYSHLSDRYLFTYLQTLTLPPDDEIKPIYSNMGLGILAYSIERHMGQNLQSLLNEHLFRPLGMSSSTLVRADVDPSRIAMGYSGDQPYFMRRNTALPNWTFSPVMIGTGGAYSTAPDLMRFLRAHLGYLPEVDSATAAATNSTTTTTESVLPEHAMLDERNALVEALKPSRAIVAHHRKQYLTMGWYVENVLPGHKPVYFYHGMISGFNAYIGFEPSQKIAVVVLRNNFNWEDKIGHNLLARLSLAKQQSDQRCLAKAMESGSLAGR
ncbi:Hypothetical protein HDN1F_24700 [gamma proteobacterium HdN1]|nr:Hypothetical protein HDN1F_24700 [gamma proteobacterium HdN1]